MDEDERPASQKPPAPMPNLRLTPEHKQQIAEFSGLYLPPLAEAVEFSEDELVGRLYALLYASKEKGTPISRKHAKAIKKIAMDASGGHIVAEKIRHVFRKDKPHPGTISQAYAKLYQPSEAMGANEKMAGVRRIELDGKGLGQEKVKELGEKYAEFVDGAVEALRGMGHETPTSARGIVELWKDVSSIIWSNFSQAQPLNNQQHRLAECMENKLLNCSSSGYPAADIMAQFGVLTSQVSVARGAPKSNHAINRCHLPGNPESVFVETRAEYPDYYGGLELSFGTYPTLDKVLREYPVLYGETGFGEIDNSTHIWQGKAQTRIRFDEKLDREIENAPNSASNYWNYVIRGCMRFANRGEGIEIGVGNKGLAQLDFEKAISIAPQMPDAYIWLAKVFLNTDYYRKYLGDNLKQSKEAAIDVIKAGIKENGKSAALYEELGSLAEDYDESINAYSRAIELAPTAGLYRARAEAITQKITWGLKAAEFSKLRHGLTEKLYGKKAELSSKAISDLEKAAKLEPWHTGTYVKLAEVYKSRAYDEKEASGGYSTPPSPAYIRIEKDAEQAIIRMWEGALAADPANARTRIEYARWIRTNYPSQDAFGGKSPEERAIELLEGAVKLAPTSANYYDFARGLESITYNKEDMPAKRIFDLYLKAIETGPNNVDAYIWFSSFLQRLSTLSISGFRPLPLEIQKVGQALGQKSFWEYSSAMLEEGAKRNPSEPRIPEKLARMYEDGNLLDRAIKHLKEAIRIRETTARLESAQDYWFNQTLFQCYSDLAGMQASDHKLEDAEESIAKAKEYRKKGREIGKEEERKRGTG